MPYGQLIPTSGGKPLVLNRRRHFLGRRQKSGTHKISLPADEHLCEMLFLNDYWQVRALGDSLVFVNGRPTTVTRLENGDEVMFGSGTYMIQYATAVGVSDAAVSIMKQQRFQGTSEPKGRAERGRDSAQKHPGLGVLTPNSGGDPFVLRKPRLTIGRSKSCDLRIPVSTISSIHAGLELQRGFWRIQDLKSQNGIRVNGVQFKRCWLRPQDSVAIGDIGFRIEYSAEGDPPEDDDATNFEMSLVDRLGWTQEDVEHAAVASEAD